MKVDAVLQAAEALLACCHEVQKTEVLARLRDIKAQWEETVTYMTHCHRWGGRGPCQAFLCRPAANPLCPPRGPGAPRPGNNSQVQG